MNASQGPNKPPKTPRQKAPVRHVALTDEAKRAYEQLVQQREERERTYGRHVHIAKSTHKGK